MDISPPSEAVFNSCGNLTQGISPGWGDTYGWHLPGQEISLKNVKDGDYRLITKVDYKDLLMETDETDNESCVLLHIVTSTPTPTVAILNDSGCDDGSEPPPPPPGGDVTVDSIVPDSAARDSSVFVMISGTGFEAGMEVTLENGKGPRPTVSDVTVSSTMITALITMKKGAKAVSWDVRVGSGVLDGGFTVTVP